MFFDDLPPKKAEGFTPRVLDNLSVDELAHYVTELEAEIIRVKADIEKKKVHQNAASDFFKK